MLDSLVNLKMPTHECLSKDGEGSLSSWSKKSRKPTGLATFRKVKKVGRHFALFAREGKGEGVDFAARSPTVYSFSAITSISKLSVDNLSFRLKAPSVAP